MNPIKSPHQLLLEEAGASLDPSPGLINTPQQMLMQQANVLPHFAPGGAVTAADMQAELGLSNLPKNTKLRDEINRNLLFVKHHPFQSLWNALNFLDVGTEGYEAAKAARAGKTVPATEHGFRALSAIPAALPSMPLAASLGVPVLGQMITDYTAEHMAQNPEFRKQMMSTASTPLGGALSGDAGLAAHIMGGGDYSDALEQRQYESEEPSILAGTTLPKK